MPISEWEAWRFSDIERNNAQAKVLLTYLEEVKKDKTVKAMAAAA